MRRQWSTLVVLVGSLVFLGSLYLPWQQATCTETESRNGSGSIAGLLNLFSLSCPSVDGLSSGAGRAAALVALLLIAAAVRALARPQVEDPIPVGTFGLALSYFATATVRETESLAQRRSSGGATLLHTHLGTYVGVAAAELTLLAVAAPRVRELVWDRSALNLSRLGLVAGLLATLLLPWQSFSHKGVKTFTVLGIEHSVAVLAASCTLLLVIVWWRSDTRTLVDALLLAGGTALLTSAAITTEVVTASRTFVAWIGVGLAIALVVSAAIGRRLGSVVRRPTWLAAAGAVSGAIFIVGLFLPW